MTCDILRHLVSKSGKTQKDIARELGMSQQRFNFYVTGKREPDNSTLKILANYFNVSVDYLLENAKKGSATPKGDGPATEREQLLLEKFRAASPAIQELVLKALKDMDGREG